MTPPPLPPPNKEDAEEDDWRICGGAGGARLEKDGGLKRADVDEVLRML